MKTTYTESGVCDVCKKQSEHTIVCSSSCGAMSYRYCLTCLNAGREPYSALTSMGIEYKQVSESFRQRILDPSLCFFGKKPEDFDKDVEEFFNSLPDNQEIEEADKTTVKIIHVDLSNQEQQSE